MCSYTITISSQQDTVLSIIAAKASKTIQQVLDKQALFRVKEQIDVWISEYMADVSALIEEQIAELSQRFVATKRDYLVEVTK